MPRIIVINTGPNTGPTPPPPPPPLPTPSLTAVAVSNAQINLMTTYVPGPPVATYTFQYSTAFGGPWTTLITQANPGLNVASGLLPMTAYYFQANVQTAESPPRTSAWSAVVSATTLSVALPGQVTNLVATPASSTEIDLTWSAAVGATTYTISRVQTALVPSVNGTTIPVATQIVDLALNIWTVAGGVIYENGSTAGFSGGVTLLLYYGGQIYQENTSGFWYEWTGATWISVAGDPRLPASTRFAVDMVYIENLAPFTSWANVQTAYGATGNGSTDDTTSIQNGLNALTARTIQVLYFPAGTYKISSTLTLTGNPGVGGSDFGVALIGAGASTTTIKWAGSSGQAMLLQNGGLGARYNLLTWDGNSTAQYGVTHWWNTTSGATYGGATEHQDEIYQNMAIGIMAGRAGANYGNGDSEMQMRRVTFSHCSFSGFVCGEFNAEDLWFSECQWNNCARAVSNNYTVNDPSNTVQQFSGAGAGNMYVYRCYFNGSSVADFDYTNTGWNSIHQSVSLGSAKFINALASGGTGPFIAKGNRVVPTSGATPIYFNNLGPLMLVDNQIVTAGSEYVVPNTAMDVLSLGNQTTSAPPTASGSQRLLSVNDTVVSGSGISSSPPTLPSSPSPVTHAVFEVTTGFTAAQIQTVINNALASTDLQPIVHFPAGNWSINTTLTVPANSKLQFVGDGWGSILAWTGSAGGSIFSVVGPSFVTFRNFIAYGGSGAMLATMTGMDSSGGRILLVGNTCSAITASNLQKTQLSLQMNPQVNNDAGVGSGITLTNCLNVVALANGGIGQINLSSNSSMFMADSWYEADGIAQSMFNIPNGTFTYLGGHMASGSHGGTQSVPPVLVNGGTATQSYIGMTCDPTNVAGGVMAEVENEVSGTSAYFIGYICNPGGSSSGNNWFTRPGPNNGEVSFTINHEASGQYANQGDSSNAALISAWTQARALSWDQVPYVPPAGATNIIIYQVHLVNTTGITISG